MNNDLLKRVEERIDFWKEGEPSTSPIVQLLLDCRAEIERLSKPYVPMTELDWRLFCYHNKYEGALEHLQQAETAVIKRAGLEIKHD